MCTYLQNNEKAIGFFEALQKRNTARTPNGRYEGTEKFSRMCVSSQYYVSKVVELWWFEQEPIIGQVTGKQKYIALLSKCRSCT